MSHEDGANKISGIEQIDVYATQQRLVFEDNRSPFGGRFCIHTSHIVGIHLEFDNEGSDRPSDGDLQAVDAADFAAFEHKLRYLIMLVTTQRTITIKGLACADADELFNRLQNAWLGA